MQFPEKYPAPLCTLAQSIAESLQRNGVEQAEAERIALDATDVLRFTHGGDAPYIPRGYLFDIYNEHKEMWEAFTGDNYEELARKFDCTVRHVRRVIAEIGRAERAKQQGDMFATESIGALK